MKSSEDRRRAGDGGPSGPSPQPSQVVEQAQQARGQEQYLHYPTVTSTDPAATQYQQPGSVGQSYPQQSQYTSEEVEEVEEGYSNEYDGHQQNLPTSEAGGDSDEHDGTGKRKAPDSNDDGSAGAEGGQRIDADGNPTNDGDPPKKKRRRQALSCTECKRRKIKCDRNHPCSPCARRGDQDKCRWTLLEPIVIPDEDPTNPGTHTTIHTTPYPPTLGNDKYVLRSEHEELKAHVFRLESIIAAIAPPGTFPHPLHALQQQHQSPNPYLNALNQYSILPKQEGTGPGGGPSIPQQHMYLTAGYPPLPIMLNVSTPSGAMNGGSSSTSSTSPGIFASYLHNVPFTPSNTVATSNTSFAGTSAGSGPGSGQTATIVPSSTTTNPNVSTSTPGASSSTAGQTSSPRNIPKSRKKTAVNGGPSSSHNISTSSASHGGHSHGHVSKAQARAEAKAQQQVQTHLERAHNSSRNSGVVSSSVGGVAVSRSLNFAHSQDVPDSAQSVYTGNGGVGDDEEGDDEQDADGDGDEDGSGGGSGGMGGKHVHDLMDVESASNNLDSRMDGLTA